MQQQQAAGWGWTSSSDMKHFVPTVTFTPHLLRPRQHGLYSKSGEKGKSGALEPHYGRLSIITARSLSVVTIRRLHNSTQWSLKYYAGQPSPQIISHHLPDRPHNMRLFSLVYGQRTKAGSQKTQKGKNWKSKNLYLIV